MMIAPAKSMIGAPHADATKDHQLRLQASLVQDELTHGSFTLQENTNLTIKSRSTLSVRGDITLHSDIQGEGTVILVGNKKTKVDANGNSIQRLMINNTSGIELASRLVISSDLIINAGDFLLGNYDLVLASPFTRIELEGHGQVAYNGNGRIIGQSLHSPANQAPQYDRDLSSQVFLELPENKTLNLYGTQVVYHINMDYTSTFLTPPTPPPD